MIVPLRSFITAKSRLRLAGFSNTTAVVRQLARGVIEAARPRRVVVVTEDPEVALWAASLGTRALLREAHGLNDALTRAVHQLRAETTSFVIAHGDLSQPAGLNSVEIASGVTIYLDHQGSGTNVLMLRDVDEFDFHYGANSATLHQEEARRRNLLVRVVANHSWQFDVDEISDLARIALEGGTTTPLE